MGLKLYDETSVQAIADAIRSKNGSSDTYTISEMSTAIENIPSGGGGGTHTETKTLTFLNSETPFNVGDDFLSGYGVYPQDSSYALAIAVSDGVGFAARLHNGVVDGYSASCTYSNGVFTFDAAFVLNYMGSSVYSLNCLFNDGEQTTIVNGEILTDNSFTDGFQLFAEGSMSNTTTAGGKVNITWNGGTSIGYCRCGKTAYRNAKKVKVHIDYYGDSYGHQHTNNRNWNFAVFVTDIQLTGAISLTNLINDSHCLDYIECDNNQYYGQMNLDFEIDLSEITDAVYISFQSPGVTIQGLKITVVYEDESNLYKYHWSQDGKICVREEVGAIKWFFMGLTKDSADIEVPIELVSYLPDFETPGQYMSAIAFTDPEGAWDGSHYIGFVYPGTANVKIRSWYSSNLGGGTFWGVLNITHYPFANQRNDYFDPTDVEPIDIILDEKTITTPGVYYASDDNVDGYNVVKTVADIAHGYNAYLQLSGLGTLKVEYNMRCEITDGVGLTIYKSGSGSSIGFSFWSSNYIINNFNKIKYHFTTNGYNNSERDDQAIIIGVSNKNFGNALINNGSIDSNIVRYNIYRTADYAHAEVNGELDISDLDVKYLVITAHGWNMTLDALTFE